MTLFSSILVLAEITLGSWNLKWFPSGRAEHRASVRVEKANFQDAADVIREGTKSRGYILFFQEMRDAKTATNLVNYIGNTNLHPAITTAFKMKDNRLGWQQDSIITDLPVIDSRWAYWKDTGNPATRPPRGYAYALIDAGADGLVGCFCVHMKSNYGANTKEQKTANANKRELTAAELLELAGSATTPDGRPVSKIVIAGDFNTDPFSRKYKDENTTRILESGSFVNCFAGLPLEMRGTHPGTKSYPDSTIDFFFHRGFKRFDVPTLSPEVPLSDHRMIWMTVAAEGENAPRPKFKKTRKRKVVDPVLDPEDEPTEEEDALEE